MPRYSSPYRRYILVQKKNVMDCWYSMKLFYMSWRVHCLALRYNCKGIMMGVRGKEVTGYVLLLYVSGQSVDLWCAQFLWHYLRLTSVPGMSRSDVWSVTAFWGVLIGNWIWLYSFYYHYFRIFLCFASTINLNVNQVFQPCSLVVDIKQNNYGICEFWNEMSDLKEAFKHNRSFSSKCQGNVIWWVIVHENSRSLSQETVGLQIIKLGSC